MQLEKILNPLKILNSKNICPTLALLRDVAFRDPLRKGLISLKYSLENMYLKMYI